MNENTILLWEILAKALLIGTPVAIIIFFIFQIRDAVRRNQIVKQNSKYYQNVLELNRRTTYHRYIGSNGNVKYNINASSKSKFDSIDRNTALVQYISEKENEATGLLVAVRENRRAYEEYIAQFQALSPQNSVVDCELLNIQFSEFLKKEQKLVASAKLTMTQTFRVICYVEYTSPHGQNSYSKKYVFSEYDIEYAVQEKQKQEAYKKTEEYRRKTERAKINQSVRYDILKRDKFRCQLCGRSAKDGIELEVDHIIPISKGGTSVLNNLQTLCRDCNRGKGSKY